MQINFSVCSCYGLSLALSSFMSLENQVMTTKVECWGKKNFVSLILGEASNPTTFMLDL